MTYFLIRLCHFSNALMYICLFFSFELVSSEITLPLDAIFSALDFSL